MKKLAVFFILILVFQCTTMGQTEIRNTELTNVTLKDFRFKNIVKINSLSIALKNLSIQYERVVSPKLTASVGLSYRFSSGEPKIIAGDGDIIGLHFKGIKGYSFTPEVRYYMKKCDPTLPEGLYAGLYLRYTQYQSGATFDYYPADGSENSVFDADIRLNEYGIGIQIGYQVVILKRFIIDFMFLGPRFSKYNFKYEFDANVSEEFLQDLSDYINDVIDKFGYDYKINISRDGDHAALGKFNFVNLRFGVSFGFAF